LLKQIKKYFKRVTTDSKRRKKIRTAYKRLREAQKLADERLRKMKEKGVARTIVKKRHIMEMVFLFLMFTCALNAPFVRVNYDLTEYLPDYSTSKQAINLMEEQFGYPGTARIMIENVSIYEAFMYKQMIEDVDTVDTVTWMKRDVFMGEDFLRMNNERDYYKDRCAVMDITFEKGDSADETKEAIGKIQKLLGEKGKFSGPAVENKSLEETLASEIRLIMAAAVVFILIILILTTSSWAEPFLFLSVMGVAILLNMGSNLFLGTISFMSHSVAAVLQLATSMDYSVFLLHTYIRLLHEHPEDKEKAMVCAIEESAVPILSSAMTTFVGFMALLIMRFGLGRDVGLVLGKSIICSVITVLFLMPALLLRFGDLIDKTKHKEIMPSFKHTAKFVYKMRYAALVLMIILAIPCYVAQSMNHFTFGNSALGKSIGTKVYTETAEIEERFGRSNLYLLMVPNETPIRERALADEVENLYFVKSVTALSKILPVGIPESIIPNSIISKLRTDRYTRMLVYTKTESESPLAFETCGKLEQIMKKYYPNDSYIVGNTPSTIDVKELMVPDYTKVNILSLIAVGIVVGVAFHSVLLPILVLIPINVATFLNMTIPYLSAESFMFNGFIVVSCIQLGATVDYSILLTNNYMFNRERGVERKKAALDALQRSILSIITSGLILTVAGYGVYKISSVDAISSLGHLIGRGGFLSMLMVIFGVPALLTVFDKWIFKEKELKAKWKEKRMIKKQAALEKGGDADDANEKEE